MVIPPSEIQSSEMQSLDQCSNEVSGMALSLKNQPRLERVGEHVTFEFYDHDHIVFINLTSYDNQSVDQWATRFKEIRASWPDGKPVLTGVYLSALKMNNMPYVKDRIIEMLAVRSELNAYSAALLPRTLIGQVVYYAIRSSYNLHPNFHLHTFFEQADALRWLRRCWLNNERKLAQSAQ